MNLFRRLAELDQRLGLHAPRPERIRRFWWLPLAAILLLASILYTVSLAWDGPWWAALLLLGGVPSGMISGYWLALRQVTEE